MKTTRGKMLVARGPDVFRKYNADAGPLDWLVELLWDAGGARQEFTANGNEYMSLTWRELHYWQASTRKDVSPAVQRDIIELSGHYVDQIARSRDLKCPPPFQLSE